MNDVRKLKVLIVDDEYLIAADLREAVEKLGHEILGPVPSVEQALTIIGSERPDVVLLDETLVDGSAVPVAQELSRRNIPFAIVSGHARSPSGDPLLRNAIRVPKPTTQDNIREALNALSTKGSEAQVGGEG